MGKLNAKAIRQLAWKDLAQRQYWPLLGGQFVLQLLSALIGGIGLIAVVVAVAAALFTQTAHGGPTGESLAEVLQNPALILTGLLGGVGLTVPILYSLGFHSWGDKRMALEVCSRTFKFEQFLSGWGHGWKMCWTLLVEYTYIQLWLLLLVIPGIVKAFSYAMTQYVQVDHPEWTANQCITESRRLMSGNRWRLFCLGISFIKWYLLLMLLTLFGGSGIAMIFLSPYLSTAFARFYLEIKREKALPQ